MSEGLEYRLRKYFNYMDFRAQPVAERFFHLLIAVVAIVSYLVGFYFQKFSICIYSTLAATVFCLIVVVPGQLPWWKRPEIEFQKDIEYPPQSSGEKDKKDKKEQ